MKLVFLDIDGVLNYELFWKDEAQDIKLKNLSESAPKGSHDICKDKIGLLNDLIEQTEAKIIISSTWRKYYTLDELRELFKFMGFKGEIIDTTPYLNFQKLDGYNYSVPRGCEIKAWLEINKDKLGVESHKIKYLILDDDSDMLYNQRHAYFRVDPYCGLTYNVIYRAVRYLNS